MFYLVSFDISDDRVRYRVVKELKAYGYRVQKSVFECPSMTERKFLRLKDRLESLIDWTTDSVRYYRLCRGCLRDVEVSGLGTVPEVEDYGFV
ncbi:MAG: CRISPR-associated endonuclease Cas2 [Deltaproteobacteria bacterium]|nr:CRISPR-associated endonuclease Cas2 [Deltaproteobacteria bacterium]